MFDDIIKKDNDIPIQDKDSLIKSLKYNIEEKEKFIKDLVEYVAELERQIENIDNSTYLGE